MIVVEIAVAVLGTTMFVAAVAALWIGLLGVLGAVRFARCARCGHLGLTSSIGPLQACIRCRHDHFFHPMLAVHRAHLPHHARRRGRHVV